MKVFNSSEFFVCIIVLMLSLVSAKLQISSNLVKSSLISKQLESTNVKNFVIATSATDQEKSQLSTKESENCWQGNCCILGGALAHLTFGTLYCWGNFLSYTPDNLKFFDGQLHPGKQPDALYVIPYAIITQAIAMPFGPTISKYLGLSRTLLLGSWIAAAAVYLASYQIKLANFMLFYSLMFGAGVGIAYTAPMTAGWKWKPSSKGLVSGGILAGFGSGGFFFSMLGSRHVNPLSLNMANGRFPPEVYARFPSMLRKLAVFYAIVSTLGSLMIVEKPAVVDNNNQAKAAAAVAPGLSIMEALRTPQFWIMWSMAIASATAGLNTAAAYKTYAATSPALIGDSYQFMVGGVGAIINGLGRMAWGAISDKLGFKNSFTVLTLLQVASLLAYPFSIYSKTTFALNTYLLFFCLAGNFALMPPATQKMFGAKDGAAIYGVLFSAFAIASVVGGMLTKSLSLSLGWTAVFRSMAAMSVLATLLVSLLQPVKTFKESSV